MDPEGETEQKPKQEREKNLELREDTRELAAGKATT